MTTAIQSYQPSIPQVASGRTVPVRRSIFNMTDMEFSRIKDLASMIAGSGLKISSTNKAGELILIMLKGAELGMEPFAAISSIDLINGVPTLDPAGMLALAEAHGALEYIDIIEETAERSTIEVKRVGREKPYRRTWTIQDAEKMRTSSWVGGVKTSVSLIEKDNWQQQPAVMLKWRNVSAICKTIFGDIIQGMYTPEEMGADVIVDEAGRMTVVGETPPPLPQLSIVKDSGPPPAQETRPDTPPRENPVMEGQHPQVTEETQPVANRTEEPSTPIVTQQSVDSQQENVKFSQESGKQEIQEEIKSAETFKAALIAMGLETKEQRLELLNKLGFNIYSTSIHDVALAAVKNYLEQQAQPEPETDMFEDINDDDVPFVEDVFAKDADLDLPNPVASEVQAEEEEEQDEFLFVM